MAWLRQECSDAICAHLDCPSCGCMAFITGAIRQAENEKLEEAAACAAGAVLRAYDHGFERGDLALVAANACRSLKTEHLQQATQGLFDSAPMGGIPLVRSLKSKD